MGNLISNIENLRVHDASSVHGIIANASSYSLVIGDPSSVFSEEKEIGLPVDINSMLVNLTPNLVLRDSSDADIECYNKIEMDAVVNSQNASINTVENHCGRGESFDPFKTYVRNSFVIYDNAYWKCLVDRFQGAWDPAAWEQTSLLREIEKLYGTHTTVEHLTVAVSVNRGTGVVAGTTIKVTYDAATGKPQEIVTLDSEGKATFFMDYGDRYEIEYSGIPGYTIPKSVVTVAGIPERTISLVCRQLNTGVFIIDNNGIETDYELWDESRTDGRFVKFTNSTLCSGGYSADNSIIISKNWMLQRTNKNWQIEYKDIPSLPNIINASTAISDYNGWQNCQLAYNDCITPNAAGKTFVDLYNEIHPDDPSIGIAEYLPAITCVMNITETFMGRSVYGYLPSMGQIHQIYTNRDAINIALQKIDASVFVFSGDDRWFSSTEYGKEDAWSIKSNGDPNLLFKQHPGYGFPRFAFPLFAAWDV